MAGKQYVLPGGPPGKRTQERRESHAFCNRGGQATAWQGWKTLEKECKKAQGAKESRLGLQPVTKRKGDQERGGVSWDSERRAGRACRAMLRSLVRWRKLTHSLRAAWREALPGRTRASFHQGDNYFSRLLGLLSGESSFLDVGGVGVDSCPGDWQTPLD